MHYRHENAPWGAPQRCTDGCPIAEECPWYAPRLYLDLVPLMHVAQRSSVWWERLGARLALDRPSLVPAVRRIIPGYGAAVDYRGWPVSVISEDPSREARLRALETGPWGRCVYRCDNDVVDHQVVSMELESGASAVLVLHGHSHREGRTVRYDGTRATLVGQFYAGDEEIRVHDHVSGEVEVIRPAGGVLAALGHSGGDAGLMAGLVHTIRDGSQALTTARESLESHLMAFAAEEARRKATVLHMDEYRRCAEVRTSHSPEQAGL
jgi:hypothetical protein